MRRNCHFCKKNTDWIDYKNADDLRRYLGIWAKLKPASETGTCARHQRLVVQAIKRARFLALLPYTER